MKSGEAFQVFRLVDTIIMDKTGTLTQGKPYVAALWARDEDTDRLLFIAASAEYLSEHPLARAVVKEAADRNIPITEAQTFEALSGQGVAATIDGRAVLLGTKRLLEEHGVKGLQLVDSWLAEHQDSGKTIVLISEDQELTGALALADQVKADSQHVIAEFKKKGIRIIMATGDHINAGKSIARLLGIEDVEAELLPADKYALVRKLQLQGYRVAFVGDGINDAPSLMQSDIGIAIGTGTDIAIDAADVVIPGEKLSAILRAHSISSTSYSMTIRNVIIAFLFNGVGILAAFTGQLHPVWAMLAMSLSLVTAILHTMLFRL